MKSGSKKSWGSILPLRLRSKSVARFCMFSKVRSAGLTPGSAPVYLNVYDLTPMNGYVYWAGLGIFHSGIEGIAVYILDLISISNCMHLSFVGAVLLKWLNLVAYLLTRALLPSYCFYKSLYFISSCRLLKPLQVPHYKNV